MASPAHHLDPLALSLADVMQDLETGRSLPLKVTEPLLGLASVPRPTLGGPAFRWTYVTARVLGRVHPRLARRALMRLWFTPWVHPSALKPVHDLPGHFTTWSQHAAGTTLHGYVGGAGPTAVLVHGWAGRAADWRLLAADLVDAGWRVVVPDLPAHGTTPGRRTDLFQLGRALAGVFDQEQPDAVVTHSMGFPATVLAIEEGAHAPVTIVALAPGRRIAHAVDGFARRARLRPALVEELRHGLERGFGHDVWDVLDVDRSLADLPEGGLVVHDVDDDEVPLTDARQIAHGWPGAQLRTTTGLGHRRVLRDGSVRASVVETLSRPPVRAGASRGSAADREGAAR